MAAFFEAQLDFILFFIFVDLTLTFYILLDDSNFFYFGCEDLELSSDSGIIVATDSF